MSVAGKEPEEPPSSLHGRLRLLRQQSSVLENLGKVLLEDKINDEIFNLSNTFKDKAAFVVFTAIFWFSGILLGYAPNYFYLWYFVVVIIFVPNVFLEWKSLGLHYYFLEFCYFANVIIICLYLLTPDMIGPNLYGRLFSVCYAIAMGPVFTATFMWRSSLVLHSTEKMTILLIHTLPAFSMWGIRWFSSEDQGFVLCAHPTEPGVNGCNNVGMYELIFLPIVVYIFWNVLYVLIVYVWLSKHITENGYITSYKTLITKQKKTPMYKMSGVFGEKHRKFMYYFWNGFVATFFIFTCYYSYHSYFISVVIGAVVMLSTFFYGASFYIDVFSKRYYAERVLRMKVSWKSSS